MNSDLFFDLKNPKLTDHRSSLTAPRSQNSFVRCENNIWESMIEVYERRTYTRIEN